MSSQTLLRNTLQAMLDADLSKNELKAGIALVVQTIGYGKRTDSLTMKRVANVARINIRGGIDRIEKPVEQIIEKGIFCRKEHRGRNYDFTYSVSDRFFEGQAVDRFFAPAFPVAVTNSQGQGNDSQSLCTYRDKPSTEINHNNKQSTPAPEPDLPEQLQAQDKIVVCDESIPQSKEQKIEKPEAVSPEAYKNLLPALKTLPGIQAVQILGLIAMAVLEGSIKTTQERMGGGLIKAAKQGTLDVSRLESNVKPVQTHPSQHFWRSEKSKNPDSAINEASIAAGLASMEKLLKELG